MQSGASSNRIGVTPGSRYTEKPATPSGTPPSSAAHVQQAPASFASPSVSHVVPEVQRLNKTGLSQMREGFLAEALATLQLAQSLCAGLVGSAIDNDDDDDSQALQSFDEVDSNAVRLDEAIVVELRQAMTVKSTTLNNLGCLYRRMGRLDEASHYLQQARNVEHAYGRRLDFGRRGPIPHYPPPPPTAAAASTDDRLSADASLYRFVSVSTLLNMSSVFLALGHVDEALGAAAAATEKAKQTHQEVLVNPTGAPSSSPPTSEVQGAHQGYVVALHNLAVAQQSSPNPQDRRHAASTMIRALSVSEQYLGESHATTAMLRAKCGVPHIPGGSVPQQPPQHLLRPRAPTSQGPSNQNSAFNRNVAGGGSAGTSSRLSPVSGGGTPLPGSSSQKGATPVGAPSASSSLRRSELDVARSALRCVEDSLPAVDVPRRKPASSALQQPPTRPNIQRPEDQDDVMQGAAFVDHATPRESTDKSTEQQVRVAAATSLESFSVVRSVTAVAASTSDATFGNLTNTMESNATATLTERTLGSASAAAAAAGGEERRHGSEEEELHRLLSDPGEGFHHPNGSTPSTAVVVPPNASDLVKPVPTKVGSPAAGDEDQVLQGTPNAVELQGPKTIAAEARGQPQPQAVSAPPPPLTIRHPVVGPLPQPVVAPAARPGSNSVRSVASSSHQSSSHSGSAGGGSATVTAPSFMRFAPTNGLPPPLPTTFHDIRMELQIEREQRLQAEAAVKRSKSISDGTFHHQHHAQGSRLVGKSSTLSAAASVASATGKSTMLSKAAARKQARAEEEAAEEQRLREAHAKEQRAKLDEIKRQRLAAFQQERRHIAARKIQRLWRWWWRNVGYRRWVHAHQKDADAAKEAEMEAIHGHLSQQSGGLSSRADARRGAAAGGSSDHPSNKQGPSFRSKHYASAAAASSSQSAFYASSSSGTYRRPTATNPSGHVGGVLTHQNSHTLRAVSRAVVWCANRWLARTAGGRLLRRIVATQRTNGGSFSPIMRSINTMQDLIGLMRRVQCVWRGAVARIRYQRRRDAYYERLSTTRDVCRRSFAALRIQCSFRCHLARVELSRRRTKFMLSFALRIQRWFRRLVEARANAGRRLRGVNTRTRAAVVIQRCWRGYCGRLQATMLRLRQKMANMRAKDRQRAVLMQRVGRAFQTRRALGAVAIEARHSRKLALASRGIPMSIEELQKQKAAQAADAALKRISEQWQRYVGTISDRLVEAAAIREHERDHITLPLAVDPVGVREHQAYEIRVQPHQLRLERAAEEHTRLLELETLKRHRAARAIQSVYRRWKKLATAEGTRRIQYATRVYMKRSFEQKEQTRAQAAERARLRAVNDLGRDAREAKIEVMAEAESLKPGVRTRYADEYTADSLRNHADRRATVRDIKSREVALAHQSAQDVVSLRASLVLPPSTTSQQPLPTFLTTKQKRLLSPLESSQEHH